MNKYQLNMFAGSQSFILRLNSAKEVEKFINVKKLNSDSVIDYLQKLEKKLSGYLSIEDLIGKKKPVQPVYRDQLEKKLIGLGMTTEKRQMAMLKKAAGYQGKKFKKITEPEAQAMIAKLLMAGGENNVAS